MSSLLASLHGLVQRVLDRLYNLLQAAPPGTLQLTGVLGLATLLVAYYQLRRNAEGAREGRDDAARRRQQPASSGPATGRPRKNDAAVALQLQALPATPLGKAVRSQLVGIKKVTISAPGVLLQEWTASELQEAARLRPTAADVLREVATCADIYIITHVVDDVGQAAVSGALEAAGLVGKGLGKVKAHKLLFCSTLEGKVSLVRQLEPDLHIDGHSSTIEDLKRFMPQLLHVARRGAPPAAQGAPNVVSAPSLAAFFGHPDEQQ